MASFDNGVSAPGGMSYAAPLLSFQNFSNWAADDPYEAKRKQQEQELNQQRIAAAQRQAELAKTFQGGLPRDAQGNIDYKQAVSMLAQKGDIGALWNGADAMLAQSATNMSPLLSGGGQPPQGQPQGQPASLPARPPAPVSGQPQGDAPGSVISRVTDILPPNSEKIGVVAGNVAKALKVDPNAPLTPQQSQQADNLLRKYAERNNIPSRSGDMPPSANAGLPAPKAAQPSSFRDRFAAAGDGNPQPQPGAMPPQPGPPMQPQGGAPGVPPQQIAQAAPQPQQPQGPITPQVPLPKGFTDPQAAMLALRTEAARLSANPRAKGQVDALNDWAARIDASLAPVTVQPNATIVDPRTGKMLAQGPGAATMANNRETGATLDADAENYRQTGKLPPNMGRGIQGQHESNAIRTRAAEMEIGEGGNPADWSSRWQSFATQAAGKRALETRAAGLSLAENEASSLIPRVREISGKIERTKYPTLNSLILASQKGTGGTDVIKLGIAIESLVPVYARVLKPVGQVGQGDMARAHDILDKAWSDGQINAALDQMEVELKSARSALDKTMSESENRRAGKKEGADTKTSTPESKSQQWVRGPDGKLGPSQ